MTRSERTYYLLFALYCSSWAFLTPVYPLFLLSRGLDLFQINVVFAVYLIGAFAFEVPTGALADIVGRRTSFLLSCALRCLAFGMYWFAQGFADCIVAEFVDALGTTLASGALDAWVVDGMRAEDNARPAARVFARAQMLASPLMIVSGVAGAYIADANISTPWICGATGFAVTAAVALLLMREGERPPRPSGVLASWLRTTRDGIQAVRRAPVLQLLCALTAAISFAVMPTWHYWPVRLQELSGERTWLLGWVWALVTLAAMAGNGLMPRLIPRFRRERVLGIASFWRGGMLAFAVLSPKFLPALLALVVLQGTFGLIEPTLQGWMNEHAESDLRATVLSVRSMSFTLGGGLGLLCLGLLARAGGIPVAWGVSAALLVVTAPAFLLLARETRPAPEIAIAGAGDRVS